MLYRRLFPVLDDQDGQRIGREEQRLGIEGEFFDLDNISHVQGEAWRLETEHPEDHDRDHSREPLVTDRLHILKLHADGIKTLFAICAPHIKSS